MELQKITYNPKNKKAYIGTSDVQIDDNCNIAVGKLRRTVSLSELIENRIYKTIDLSVQESNSDNRHILSKSTEVVITKD